MEQHINREADIYKYIKEYSERRGYCPSIREIGEVVGLKSSASVHWYIKRLEQKGLIKRNPTKPRALEVCELESRKKGMFDIPIIKGYEKGKDLLSEDNIEGVFPLPVDYIKNENALYMFKVSGKSMINAGINDNDLAIMEQTKTANNGEIVLVAVNDIVTIKRFFKENNKIRLQFENANKDSMIVDNCTILGKLVGVYRSYK